jgi:cbb3-type cytochrome oxidase subunit 3
MDHTQPTGREVVIKTAVTHTVTYFIVGFAAFLVFDYHHLYANTTLALFMRQTTERLVMAGPLFQPIRGVLFGIVFFSLRDAFFGQKNGWLLMWMALVFIGILGAFGPAPGSLEGMIYTVLPLRLHLIGMPEVLLQSLLLSVLVVYWVHNPRKKALTWVMGTLFSLVVLLSTLGLLTQG